MTQNPGQARERWAAVVIDEAGRRQYIDDTADGPFTRFRGSAARYSTKNAALYEAHMRKDSLHWIKDVDAEQIPNPRRF